MRDCAMLVTALENATTDELLTFSRVVNPTALFDAVIAPALEADDIILTILQPVVSTEADAEMESSVVVTHEELDAFVVAYRAACAEACAPTLYLERGAWCRFCAAKPICPAHTGPLLDLASFEVPTPTTVFWSQPAKEAYLQALADGLNLVDAVKDIGKALHDQAKRALENGDRVPGFGLSKGRAERHWRDEQTAVSKLIALGLFRDDIIAEEMRSVKQVEIRAKARGVKIPTEFIVSTRSGSSLARAENARVPTPGRNELARLFSEALEGLQGGGRT